MFNTPDDVVIPLTPAYSFPQTSLTLSFANVLPDGVYRLTLSGTKAIFDTSGNPLMAASTTSVYFTIDRSAIQAPTANPQTLSLAEDGSLPIMLTGTDPQSLPLTYSIVSNPLHGVLSALDPATHVVTYTPNSQLLRQRQLQFPSEQRRSRHQSTATICLTVTAVNTAPAANPQSLTVAAWPDHAGRAERARTWRRSSAR